MQLFTHGQWWSKSYSEKGSMYVWERWHRDHLILYNAGMLVCVFLCVSPPHSCHTRCSVSSAEVCRSGMWHTTSSAPGFPLSPRFYKAELGNHRLCLRPHPLGLREKQKEISTFTSTLSVLQYYRRPNRGATAVSNLQIFELGNLNDDRIIPLGKTPGSMKVAMLKLANTKRKMMPLYRGTRGEMALVNHGHLRGYKRDRRML